jgi:hypothetical protein
MFFSWEKHIRSLTSKNSGTLIVILTVKSRTVIGQPFDSGKPNHLHPMTCNLKTLLCIVLRDPSKARFGNKM